MMPNMQNFYPAWLNASYYQNIPHNEVNWAQLAQQWMVLRATEPRFVAQPIIQQFQSPPPSQNNQMQMGMGMGIFPHPHQIQQQNAPPLPPMEDLPPPPPSAMTQTRPPPLFPAFESAQTRFPRRFSAPHGDFNQFTSSGNVHQPPGLLPTPQFRPAPQQNVQEYANFASPRPSFNIPEHQNRLVFTGQQNFMPEEHVSDLSGPFANQYQGSFDEEFFQQDMDYRKWRPPLMGEDNYYPGTYSSEGYPSEEAVFDSQQRKNLPAWIREGLEKVERERQKQKEKDDRDEFLKEKQENKIKNLAKRGKSRFDDSESDDDENGFSGDTNDRPAPADEQAVLHSNQDDYDVSPNLSVEERRAELLAKLRRWLTEILMDVTTGEIEKVVQETHKAKLRKAQPKVLAQTSALATITSLGADYGSEDDDDAASSTTLDDDRGTDTSPEDQEKIFNDPFKRPQIPIISGFSKKKISCDVEKQPREQELNERSIDDSFESKSKDTTDSDRRKLEDHRRSSDSDGRKPEDHHRSSSGRSFKKESHRDRARKRSRSRSSSPKASKKVSRSSKRSKSKERSDKKSNRRSRSRSRESKSDRHAKDGSKKSKKSNGSKSRSRSRSRSKGRSRRR